MARKLNRKESNLNQENYNIDENIDNESTPADETSKVVKIPKAHKTKNTTKKTKTTKEIKETKEVKIPEESDANKEETNIKQETPNYINTSLIRPTRKNNSLFITSFFSDKGDKTNHNNHFTYEEFDNYGIWVLVDGNNGGDFENELAPFIGEMVIEEFKKKQTIEPKEIKNMLEYIHKRCILMQKDKYEDMKQYSFCSIVLMVTDYSKIFFANVGNARCFFLRDEEILYKNCDDTLAHLIYEKGNILYNEIRFRKDKNSFTQRFGLDNRINVHISETFLLLPNDKAILLSQGSWENLDEEDIQIQLNNSLRCGQWISNIIKKIRNNNTFIQNNFTLCGIFMDRPLPYVREPNVFEKFGVWLKNNFVKILVAIFLIVVIISSKIGYDYYWLNEYSAQIKKAIDDGDRETAEQNFLESIPFYREALNIYNNKLSKISKKIDYNIITDVNYKIEQSNLGHDILALIKSADDTFINDEYESAKGKYIKSLELMEKFLIKNKLNKDAPQIIKDDIVICGILQEAYIKKMDADIKYESAKTKKAAIKIYKEILPLFEKYEREKICEEIMSKINAIEPEKVVVLDTTNYIGQGDVAFGKEQYYAALELYRKAISETSNNDKNIATGKINMTSIFINGLEIEIMGDNFRNKKENDRALVQYKNAIVEYNKLSNNNYFTKDTYNHIIRRVTTKIDNIK
ncbi:MAG: protein phosphatase 2C family protein [Fusobacteriaceae bacterium]|jgi:serine/threonine protein phosphatase PrpC|nr:protein phosphatase 2C family protein [Fusobacteriaceae bacterium]